MRAFVLLIPLFCAVGCGPRPASPGAPASPLARAALAEWEVWGRIVVEGWPDTRPQDTAATPARFARIVEYWNAVPGQRGVVLRLQTLRSYIAGALPGDGDNAQASPPRVEDIENYSEPAWSAAFISAMARRAGLPESDLPSSDRHARYIDAMLVQWLADPDRAPFRPHAPDEYAPRPGDLLCADRNRVLPLTHWTGRLAELGRSRPMHCDIVVRGGPGQVRAIGGNVQGMVVLRHLPADPEGRVLPSPPDQPQFVVVLEAAPTRRTN